MDALLKLLSENSNFSTDELAIMLNEPKDYIEKQVQEYEASQIIKGYRAIVSWEKVADAGVTALIELKVTPEKEKGFDNIASHVMAFEEVDSVYLMAGAYDLAVFVKGQSIQDIAMFVSRKLSTIDAVESTATHFLLKRYKDSGINFYEDDAQEDKRSLVL